MKITVTSTSQKLSSLLSVDDLAILRWKYKQDDGGGGGIGKNAGVNTIYIENGKTATTTDSFPVPAWKTLTFGFRWDPFEVQFRTESGTSDFIMLF
jgi:hypothetical protein